jgi:hypothetical protein
MMFDDGPQDAVGGRIHFDETFKTFRLYCGESLYAFAISPELSLEHLYWGKVALISFISEYYYIHVISHVCILHIGPSCRI